MPDDLLTSFIVAAEGLAPQVAAFAEEGERSRRLPLPLVEAMARAGLFRLWTPQALGGSEVDPMTFLRVVETISTVDGSAGWCQLIAGSLSVFGGYLPMAGAQRILGCDPLTVVSGSFAPFGQAVVEPGGYQVTGRWPLASGCQHCAWLVGDCRVVDGDRPRLRSDGTPVTRMMMLPADACQILDTWDSVGLRGTGSHDYTVTNFFVPDDHFAVVSGTARAVGAPSRAAKHRTICRCDRGGPTRHRPSRDRSLHSSEPPRRSRFGRGERGMRTRRAGRSGARGGAAAVRSSISLRDP